MSDQLQLSTHELWNDGRAMTLTVIKTNPTTLRISWDLPVNSATYAGAVVLLSEERFSAVNFPTDGTRYIASSNWAAPADKIDTAQVVAAFYGFFGDNIQQTYVDVTNVDPNKIYFASIHAASNILQYYTLGQQSYPLDSNSVIEKSSNSYAGSIPSAILPPDNPVNGQIYFDPTANSVLVWNDQMSAWIKSNQATVPIGDSLPIEKSMLFFNSIDQHLKYFDGTQWVICDPTNTLVKLGAAWAPFNSIASVSSLPTSAVTGDFAYLSIQAVIAAPATYSLKFYSLGQWFDPSPDLVHVFAGGSFVSIAQSNLIGGTFDPYIPQIGDFFYNTSTSSLMVWVGTGWSRADTSSAGTPISDKVGVGTDGSYAERLRLIKILKNQLGWPAVCNELNEDHFNVAIDNALDEFRRRADNAYSHRHVSYTLKRGQTLYYLNDPRDKTDKIVNVLKVHRIGQLGISSISAENGLYAQAFFNQLYQGSNVDILSIHLMAQLAESYEKIFAGNIVFTWDEATRQLLILRNLNQEQERVVLEVVMERTEQELLLDRWAKQWLQGWAQSELWEMLGEIRSKYTSSLPGANGGITLNGESLLQRSTEQQTELLRQITDYEVGNGGLNFGNAALFFG
jgi:hypothetical protein